MGQIPQAKSAQPVNPMIWRSCSPNVLPVASQMVALYPQNAQAFDQWIILGCPTLGGLTEAEQSWGY
nr:MAG: hypothetical protein EDM05_01690 [Leptolyngbya sp. IPPAS B-1204]